MIRNEFIWLAVGASERPVYIHNKGLYSKFPHKKVGFYETGIVRNNAAAKYLVSINLKIVFNPISVSINLSTEFE
jgi:hypothetical protein